MNGEWGEENDTDRKEGAHIGTSKNFVDEGEIQPDRSGGE